MKSMKVMNSIKNYALGIAMGVIVATTSSCSDPAKKEINNANYIVREISIADVDSFNIKQSNRSKEEKKKDTIETIVKVKGYVKGVTNSSSDKLTFLLEDASGVSKFCKFYGSSDISALLEAVMDMGRVTIKPEMVNIYSTLDKDGKFLTVKKIEYANRSFDWTSSIDIAELFKNVAYDPSVKKISLDSLVNKNNLKNMAHVNVEGYVMGKSSDNDLAFVLSDEKGNSILCYKGGRTQASTASDDMKVTQLRTLVDAVNQVSTKVEVTGNFTKSYGNLLILESITTPTLVGHETNTIAFAPLTSKDNKKNGSEYIYVSAKEAKEMQEYKTVKIVGDVVAVSSDPIVLAMVKDFNGETVFCRKAENNAYTQMGVVMLNYTKNMQGKSEIINGRKMYKYIEISGRLNEGTINIEEIKDVWSPSPIMNKDDMAKVVYRKNLDHRVNFND